MDMNRNWGFKWASGSRPNPCSDAYAGKGPFESPELRAVRDYLLEKKNNVKGFLDVHSFGQMSESGSLSSPLGALAHSSLFQSCFPSPTHARVHRQTRRTTSRAWSGPPKLFVRCTARASRSAASVK